MKLSVLALDYDGTIAREDRVPSSVLDAIADARRRHVTVLLVTGRILVDLRRVAGNLDFVDGVVAENGALVHFPGSRHTTMWQFNSQGELYDQVSPRHRPGFGRVLIRKYQPRRPTRCGERDDDLRDSGVHETHRHNRRAFPIL